MNASLARRCLASLALFTSAFGVWTCGGKVVLDGDYYGAGNGEGGASGTSGTTDVSGSTGETSAASTGTGPADCQEGTCTGLGTDNCGCVRVCAGDTILEAKCAVNESNKKLQCICSYGDVFSGACFEVNTALSCNMDKGCCAKYFNGI